MRVFNLETKEVEEVTKEELSEFFEINEKLTYYEDFYNAELNEGMFYLQDTMEDIVSMIEEHEDYLITLHLDVNEQYLDSQDILTLFNMFTFTLIEEKGIPNNKGFLGIPEKLNERFMTTGFTMLYLANHDFNLGKIQVIIKLESGQKVEWVY